MVGKSDEASYIVQLLNESGKLLQKNRRAQRSMPFQLRTGRQREVPHHRDMNDNGRWDTGIWWNGGSPSGPNTMDDKNIDTFAAKENWEVELTIDMNKVFAPVTMQSSPSCSKTRSPALAKGAGRAGQESQAEHQQQYLEHDEHHGRRIQQRYEHDDERIEMMRRLGMICLFLGAVPCGGTKAAQHTLGVTGGYGYGNAR